MEIGEAYHKDLLCIVAQPSFISSLHLHVHKTAQRHKPPGEHVGEKQLAGGPGLVRLSV